MAKDYLRVKRGQVYYFNINPSVSKSNVPEIQIGYKKIKDHIQYGARPWLVVSNDVGNSTGQTCSIVPLTEKTDKNKADIPTHVFSTIEGRENIILCEQIMTVNIAQLTDYKCTLRENIMERVDEALAIQLGINSNPRLERTMDEVEEIIAGIIQKKMMEAEKIQEQNIVNVEDAVLRLGEGLEQLFDSKGLNNKKEVQGNTARVKKSNTSSKDKQPKQRSYTNKNSWTKELAEKFLKEMDEEPSADVAKRWGYDSSKKAYQIKYYLINKFHLNG